MAKEPLAAYNRSWVANLWPGYYPTMSKLDFLLKDGGNLGIIGARFSRLLKIYIRTQSTSRKSITLSIFIEGNTRSSSSQIFLFEECAISRLRSDLSLRILFIFLSNHPCYKFIQILVFVWSNHVRLNLWA